MAGFVICKRHLPWEDINDPGWVTQNGFHLRQGVIWVGKSLITPEVQGGAPPLSPESAVRSMVGTGHPTPFPRLPAGCGSWRPASLPATLSFLSPLSYSPPPPSPHFFPFSNWQSVHVTHLLGNWSPSAAWVPVWKDISALPRAPEAANFPQGFICQSKRLTYVSL